MASLQAAKAAVVVFPKLHENGGVGGICFRKPGKAQFV
jgi:hypothetical protein